MTVHGITLKDDERLVHIAHPSVVPSLPMMTLGALLVVAPFFFLFPLLAFGVAGALLFMMIAGVGAYVLARVAARVRGSVCVVTTLRLMLVERSGLLGRQVSEAPLACVQDVAYKWQGTLGALWRLGTVRVHFRGVIPTMRVSLVRHPETLTRIVQEAASVPRTMPYGDGTFERKHLT